MSRSTAFRESTTFLVVTYLLATAVAVTLPHAGINKLLSMFIPTIAVVVVTFAMTPRGSVVTCGAASASDARAAPCG